MNIVITGANRGIGLEFVRQYLAVGDQVWACHRDDMGGLAQIDSGSLHTVCWDVTQELSSEIAAQLPDSIDILINNAGVYGSQQQLDQISADMMHKVFDVNCVAPVRVVQALSQRVAVAKGRIANLSSKMGSSADNGSGGCYGYRAAKAALVICSKSMAIDLQPQGIQVVTLHPGWVMTDMTSNNGLIDTQTSVSGMRKVIDDIDDYELGAFVDFNGQLIPF
ncbi:MAG: short-chain dehydrogenase [Gammaproteobacteria bacterium]|nr:SDR family oxidoreductase [bacterium AH-315-E07]PCH60924.1 MAG: short-chain dehydrogenase [Gammaproteobacteria bacterium]